jgi:hypothetical protein
MNPSRFSVSPNKRSQLFVKADTPVVATESLSEKELQCIDDYAETITAATGLDENTAYATAIDAYAIGVNQCRSVIANISSVSAEEGLETKKENLADSKPVSDLDYFGASLNRLFQLPVGDEENDMKLVDAYGDELVAQGGLDPSVAYGVALDCYLSDPVRFRKMLSSKSSASAPTKESEILEDMYFGASLSDLFTVPKKYDQDIFDMQLVTEYAEDMERNGGISAAIAYGVALDTFLADPAAFRQRFSAKGESYNIGAEKNSCIEPQPSSNVASTDLPSNAQETNAMGKRKARSESSVGGSIVDEVVEPPKSRSRRAAVSQKNKDFEIKSEKPKRGTKVQTQAITEVAEQPQLAEDEEIALAILCDK